MRRAWYAAVLSIPVLGEQVVARPWFIPWFMRLGGQAGLFTDAEVELYAVQFRDPARAAATSRLYRHYLGMAQAVLVRHAFGERRLAATTRLLVGAEDFYIPWALVEGAVVHGDDLAVEVVAGGHWMPEERPGLIAERARQLFK
jgi:pimeloyl-ACP methyl ester carboxylesterase